MILLISGSRSLDDTEIFKRAMHEFLQSKFGEDYSAHLPLNSIIDQIVSGNAKGVDAAGERFAKKHGIDLVLFPANWEKHGKAAGPIRNEQMAKYLLMVQRIKGYKDWTDTWVDKIDVNLLAIPYPGAVGGGTNHMISTCQRYGINTFVYDASKHPRWPAIQLENSRKASQGQQTTNK